jgi:hypothetical protein
MAISPFFASLSAIIPKIQTYFWTGQNQHIRDQPNRLRWIEAGKFAAAILKKGNFFYVCLYNFTQNVSMRFLDEKNKFNSRASVVMKINYSN